MLNRYKAAPKTAAGKAGYMVLCVLSLLILAALAVLPFVIFILVYGDPWWELVFLLYPLMIPGYFQILALLDASHYLVRRVTGTVAPSKWGDRLRILYAVLGVQCGWVVLNLIHSNTSDWALKRQLDTITHIGDSIYLWAGLLIGCLWLADLIRKAVRIQREKKAAQDAAQAADQKDWERFSDQS